MGFYDLTSQIQLKIDERKIRDSHNKTIIALVDQTKIEMYYKDKNPPL